ncbi:MAG: tetratricopeptide repeat protein [Desulfomonile tiedjei]|nr:tetratricopeptide repeat protein [Desulfomonile tiedjei]
MNPSQQALSTSSEQPCPSGSETNQPRDGKLLLGVAAAVAITMALYLPNLGTDFVDWDLVPYRQILFTTDYGKTAWSLLTDLKGAVVAGYYAPLSSISLMLDKALIGSSTPSPWATLFINVLFHCLNGVLVFALLRRVGGTDGVALLGAAIFLIHPIQVSSVLWFAQRKGVLATALYLSAYLAYLRYTDRSGYVTYACALALFLLALLAKPTTIVLPAALFCSSLLAALPSRRTEGTENQLRDSDAGERQSGEPSAVITGWDLRQAIAGCAVHVRPLLPFFFSAIALALLAVVSESTGLDERVPDLGAVDRIIVSAAAVWFYIAKVLFPVGLEPIYPQWDVDAASPVWWLPLGMLAGGLVLAWRFRGSIGPFPLWCLVNFVIPLLPVIGVVKFAYLRHSCVADHFLYLPMVGLAGVVAASIQGARISFGPAIKYLVTATALIYLIVCAVQTAAYAKVWENSIALWTYNLKHKPNDWTAHNYLGHALLNAGRPQEAADHFLQTVSLKEKYISEHEGRSQGLQTTGNRAAAKREAEKAGRVKRTLGGAYHNLGNAFLRAGMHHQAIAAYTRAIELKPDLVDALTNLGVAHASVGNLPEAVRSLSRAVEVNPGYYQAQYNLGVAYDMSGNREMAERHFEKARTIRKE